MFYALSKLLRFLVSPTFWVLATLVAAALLPQRKAWRRTLLITAGALLLAFTNKPLLQLAQYQRSKPHAQALPPKPHYQVAIVMGGFGRQMNADAGQFVPYGDRSPRLFEAVRLRQMGIVDKILVTGDESSALDAQGHSTADAFLSYMAQMGIPDTCWLLEQHARNTRENATHSIALLHSLGYAADSCLLVTSATHLRRAQACFAAQGWKTDTYATNLHAKPEALRWTDFLPSARTLSDWQELIDEYVGELAYRVMGYN